MRAIIISVNAFNQFMELQKSEPDAFKKLTKLLDETRKKPFEGIGKPESLKHNLQGHWSRRINDKHRLVYKVNDENITVISCKFHYNE